MALDPITAAAGGAAAGAFIRELVKYAMDHAGKRKGNGNGHSPTSSTARLEQMDLEWRHGIDEFRKKVERDLYAADGHIHNRIHQLEGDVAVRLQDLLLSLESVRREIVALQVLVGRAGQS